jgi:hypothetical protein
LAVEVSRAAGREAFSAVPGPGRTPPSQPPQAHSSAATSAAAPAASEDSGPETETGRISAAEGPRQRAEGGRDAASTQAGNSSPNAPENWAAPRPHPGRRQPSGARRSSAPSSSSAAPGRGRATSAALRGPTTRNSLVYVIRGRFCTGFTGDDWRLNGSRAGSGRWWRRARDARQSNCTFVTFCRSTALVAGARLRPPCTRPSAVVSRRFPRAAHQHRGAKSFSPTFLGLCHKFEILVTDLAPGRRIFANEVIPGLTEVIGTIICDVEIETICDGDKNECGLSACGNRWLWAERCLLRCLPGWVS